MTLSLPSAFAAATRASIPPFADAELAVFQTLGAVPPHAASASAVDSPNVARDANVLVDRLNSPLLLAKDRPATNLQPRTSRASRAALPVGAESTASVGRVNILVVGDGAGSSTCLWPVAPPRRAGDPSCAETSLSGRLSRRSLAGRRGSSKPTVICPGAPVSSKTVARHPRAASKAFAVGSR